MKGGDKEGREMRNKRRVVRDNTGRKNEKQKGRRSERQKTKSGERNFEEEER